MMVRAVLYFTGALILIGSSFAYVKAWWLM